MERIKIGPAFGIEDSDFTIEYAGLCVENDLVKIDFFIYEDKIRKKYKRSECSGSDMCYFLTDCEDENYINPTVITLPFSLEEISIKDFDKCGNIVQILKFAEFKIESIGYGNDKIIEIYKDARKKILESPLKPIPV